MNEEYSYYEYFDKNCFSIKSDVVKNILNFSHSYSVFNPYNRAGPYAERI